jgi:hypothetical protein
MQEYRAYLLDESGRISNAAIFIRQDNDEDAIEAAKRLLSDRDIDLWQGTRRVTTLKNDDRPRQLQSHVFL